MAVPLQSREVLRLNVFLVIIDIKTLAICVVVEAEFQV